jgi:plasmid maintenance system killer protein
MKVVITSALKSAFQSDSSIQKKFGILAKKIKQLLVKFESIRPEQLLRLSGNPHKLNFQPKGIYSITVAHPFRCVFHLHNETITILDIINYHDHSLRTYEIR